MAKTIKMKVTQDTDAEGQPALSFWDEAHKLGRDCLLVSLAFNTDANGTVTGLSIYDQEVVHEG